MTSSYAGSWHCGKSGCIALMIFNQLDPKPKGKKCFAMEGRFEELRTQPAQAGT